VDAYRESPPEVAAILSGVVSKAAVYGLLRIVIAKFPEPVQDYQSTILAFATVGLIYASILAFRAPDIRSVTAYSSMAQMSLITMGLFSLNELGVDGAIVQSVAHGLVSASLFLLAGMVEVRTGTSAFAGLGGMANGRPVLATLLMTTGIIALAVPGSVAFAGEFLILAGVYGVGWGWSVVGASAIVLAAMYMLRLISAVLHGARGRDVAEDAPDVRPYELAIVVPLVALLLVLSAWPAGISERSFPSQLGSESAEATP
jgi:NADH-quinone oxidoreductase subunit M